MEAPGAYGVTLRRAGWVAAALAVAALSVALRLPFMGVPLTADEGGYAYIAWFWSAGDRLYVDLWVDRPQLLVLAYQAVQHLLGSSAEQLRLGGALYNALSTIAVTALAVRVVGWRWALACGAAFAWFSAAPRIEGFTTNGELLTTLPSTLAVLAVCVWAQRASGAEGARAVALAAPVTVGGLLAGTSFLVKQSGVDAAAAMVLVAAVLVATRSVPLRRAAGGALVFLAAALVPVAASVVHGLAIAGDDYVYAVFTYRLHADSFFAEPLEMRLAAFAQSAPTVLLELGPLLALLPFGCVALARRGAAGVVIVSWLVTASAALVAGGQFHPHYYVAVVPPLVVVAIAAVRELANLRVRRAPALATAAATAAVWLCAVVALDVRLMSEPDTSVVSWKVFGEPRYLVDASVGRYLRTNSDRNATVYAMYAGSDLYYYARRRNAYRYLWFRGLARIPGAFEDLRWMLRDPQRRPDYVALVQQPSEIDRFGTIDRLLRRHYRHAATVNGVPVYRLRSASVQA